MYGSGAFLHGIAESEKVQVVSLPVAKMKSRKRGAASQKKTSLATEECLQELPLQLAEFATRQEDPLRASGR